MDSEQLVSNPFQDMHKENVDIHKGPSLTEKLTAVKNNICEHHLNMVGNVLENKKTHKLKQIHEESCKLQYEVKLMDIDRRKNELTLKKRIQPRNDFSYDSNQIWNSEKRLGIQTESFYTQKAVNYPLRSRMKRDHTATGFIIKVREILQQTKENKHYGIELPMTPHSGASSRLEHQIQRRGSKSAPPVSQLHQDEIDAIVDDGRLPSISQNAHLKQASRVKFSVKGVDGHVQPPLTDNLIRAHTFHYGSRHKSVWDSDSDDDSSIPEKVDLRALFFGEKTPENHSTSAPPTRQSYSGTPSLRRSQHVQPPTQEELIEVSKKLRVKVDNFLGTIGPREDEKVPEPVVEEKKKPVVEKVPPVIQSKSKTILQVWSKPLDPAFQAWQNVAKGKTEKDTMLDKTSVKSGDSQRIESGNTINMSNNQRNLWEYIVGDDTKAKVNIRELYTPDELILQQMTGLTLNKRGKANIPLNSASRALRHTPTYRMRRMLSTLMTNRTKFQQQEMDNLKRSDSNTVAEEESVADDDDNDSVISKA